MAWYPRSAINVPPSAEEDKTVATVLGDHRASSGEALAQLVKELRGRGERAGLVAVGVAPAVPMEATRRTLEERKAAGLAATMQFTYRDPARSSDPSRALPGARALVVGAWWYGGAASGVAAGGDRAGRPLGTVARYAASDHYSDLRAALGELAEVLHRAGWATRVLADDNALVDRAAAHLAGIGWFGKNANILLPGMGSWCLLGSVLTDAPLPADGEVEEGCGTCRRCLRSCPTGALVAPGVLDARRCLAWLLQAEGVFPFEHRNALGPRIYGCDDCQESCPVNLHADRLGAGRTSRGPAGAGEPSVPTDASAVDILDMLRASDEDLLQDYGRWYVPRRDPRYLRRNALIVLGNTADGRLPEVEQVLEVYLAHKDQMLRAHAVWAAARVGRRDLLSSPLLLEKPSVLVREELRRAWEVEPT
jgi:epoxyqueuosine reductase